MKKKTNFIKLINNYRVNKKHKQKSKALQKCPQRKGFCLRVLTTSPKKPNSGVRKIAIVRLKNRKITAKIPGIGHNLQEYSIVLIRGGRVRDVPGVKYIIIRGVYDASPVANRKTKLSKYGVRSNIV